MYCLLLSPPNLSSTLSSKNVENIFSQYYYNSQTSQFMYWDAERSTYLPAPTQSGETDPNKESKKDKEKKEKVKIAKKIAKV